MLIAANNLILALKHPSHIVSRTINKNHLQALKLLSTIFKSTSAITSTTSQPPINNTKNEQITEISSIIPQSYGPPLPNVTKSQTESTPSKQPLNVILFKINEVPDNQPRLATHQYPTGSRQGPLVIDEIIEHHALNMMLTQTPEVDEDTAICSIWSAHKSYTHPSYCKHSAYNVMDGNTGEMLSYHKLVCN